MPDSKGLYYKYNVTKAADGSTVEDAFVLRPRQDPHAVVALKAYADSIRRDDAIFAEQLDQRVRVIAQEMEEAGRQAFNEDRWDNDDEIREWDDITSIERDHWRIQGMKRKTK